MKKEAVCLDSVKKRDIRKVLSDFFCNDANFRFAFISSLLLASLNVIRFWFYVIAGILMIWGAGLFIYRMIYAHDNACTKP